MKNASTRGFVTAALWLSGTAVSVAALSAATYMRASTEGVPIVALDDSKPRLHPTLQYNGNGACTGSGCHDQAKAKKFCGQDIGDESNIWKDSDPHAKASKNLSNKKSKDIAAKMKIEDASKDARCISCHGMAVAKKGPKFGSDALANGVGCESCHGPSEKWLELHKTECWTKKQRETMSSADLEAKFGLIDTHDLAVRGQMCVTCHLNIDQDILEAGHPALGFEMYYYNNYKFNPDWKIHWSEEGGPTQKAKQWAIGQIVSAAAADSQVAAWKAKGWKTDSADRLAKVFGEGKAIAATLGPADASAFYAEYKAKDLDKAKVIAACKALAEKGAGYKDGADNSHARDVIGSGVEALVVASGDGKMPKALEDKAIVVADAMKAGGDKWVSALNDLAAQAK